MQINNNIMAFGVWKYYNACHTQYRKIMSRLSSGQKINTAGDAPGDLSISERLRAQIRNSSAAADNIENTISYLQTADAWLQKIHDMVGRMTELAVMSNDGTKSQVDRNNLQREFNQLQKEITRITSGATAAGKFNGLYLFRGGSGVPVATGDGVYAGKTRYSTSAVYDNAPTQADANVTIPGTGSAISDAEWHFTYRNNQWKIRSHPPGLDDRNIPATCNSSTIIPFLQGPNGFSVQLNAPTNGTRYNEGDEFVLTNTNGVPGMPQFINRTAPSIGSGSVRMHAGNNTLLESSYQATYDADAQQWTIVGIKTGRLIGQLSAPPTGGGVLLDAEGYELTIHPPQNGCYSTGDRLTWDLTGTTGGHSLQTGPDSNQLFIGNAINLQADNFEVIGEYAQYSYGSVNMTLLGSGAGPISVRWGSLIGGAHLHISTQAVAQEAVAKLNIGIDHISSKRAILGAAMNRMEHTLGGLRSYEENARSTESRIRDADMGIEMTQATKLKVLLDVGTAMLAQANALPKNVMTLLGGNNS